MKKKHLETLEKINEERKLDKETKEQIRKKILKNFIFAVVILLFFVVLRLMAINLEKKLATLIYQEISAGLFIITLILFEMAYKKDSDSLAITSIEMFFISIITLLSPYLLINKVNAYTSSIGILFAIYYSIKNFIIYKNEKNDYLKEKNDITQIIKKESKDELAQEQLEKTRLEKKKEKELKTVSKINTKSTSTPKKVVKDTSKIVVEEKQNEIVTPKKRGRPRKTTKTETTTTKSTSKTTEKAETNETTSPKRKRGRPRKVNIEN